MLGGHADDYNPRGLSISISSGAIRKCYFALSMKLEENNELSTRDLQ